MIEKIEPSTEEIAALLQERIESGQIPLQPGDDFEVATIIDAFEMLKTRGVI